MATLRDRLCALLTRLAQGPSSRRCTPRIGPSRVTDDMLRPAAFGRSMTNGPLDPWQNVPTARCAGQLLTSVVDVATHSRER